MRKCECGVRNEEIKINGDEGSGSPFRESEGAGQEFET